MAQDEDKAGADSGEVVMDYPEHERTYELFLIGSKWLTIICCALLIAMAFGFFAGGGFFGGLIVFIILNILAFVLT